MFQYEMNDDGTVSITGYQGMEAVLEVPSTVDNYVVSAISNHAFEANQNLTEVTCRRACRKSAKVRSWTAAV